MAASFHCFWLLLLQGATSAAPPPRSPWDRGPFESVRGTARRDGHTTDEQCEKMTFADFRRRRRRGQWALLFLLACLLASSATTKWNLDSRSRTLWMLTQQSRKKEGS